MTAGITQQIRFDKLIELSPYIGNTPLYPITRLWTNPHVKIAAKLEWQQFGGSVKARAAYRIIRDAVESEKLQPGMRILDASSGNTGIAYAIFCAVAGIPLTICIPENASFERKHILKALGAELILTSPFESTEGAQDTARELLSKHPQKFLYVDQYSNPLNSQAHRESTAPEIWSQTRGEVTHFVAGLGTTGTFTGTGTQLRIFNPEIELIGLQPNSALHGLEGWKHLETARIPAIYNAQLADRILEVDTEEVYDMMRRAAKLEGLFLSPSAAANLLGAFKVAEQLESGNVITVFADNADKYGELNAKLFN